MNETSRISSSREFHGSRPRTFNSPSYDVRPRMALRAVVLPAPLGPMTPRIRPSSTRRSMPSSATVVPKTLRRPRASMQAIPSVLLLSSFGRPSSCSLEKFFWIQAQPLNRRVNSRPMFVKKFLPFAVEQSIARAGLDEHAEASSLFDQLFVNQFLISLQNSERVEPIIGRDIAHRGQRIAFIEHTVEDHMHDTIA